MKSHRNPALGCLVLLAITYISTPYISQLSFSGILDALSIASLALAVCQLLFILPPTCAAVFVSIFVYVVVVFNLASGEYYQFQQYYPTIQSAFLVKELQSLFFAYGVWAVCLTVALSVCMMIGLSCIATYSRPVHAVVKVAASVGLLSVSIGAQWAYAKSGGGIYFSVVDSVPIGHFIRSTKLSPFGVENEESAARFEREILVRKMKSAPSQTLPDRYLARNIGPLLGYGADYTSRVSNPRYPLFKIPVESSKKNDLNVIVLVLESVRASEMGLYGAPESATPFLDSLMSSATIVEKFYATSNYTVKSEHAIHCSALDRLIGSPLAESPNDVRTQCIPKILIESGYSTHWFHGNNLSFYNRSNYLPKLGFQYLHDADKLNADSTMAKLGWGISDIDLFGAVEDSFSTIDQPFYAEILTLSNHLPFNYDWEIDFPAHLARDDTFHQRYRRGIYYTDQAVKGFYEYLQINGFLENTILIITGDHGVWSFSDDNLPDVLKNEQMFRVPLIVHVPGKNPVLIKGNHSHLDIAPTLIDLLGLNVLNDFMGQSIYTDNTHKSKRVVFSMAEHALSIRYSNRVCIPSVQCMNSTSCTSVLEESNSSTTCYDVNEDEDILLGGGGVVSSDGIQAAGRDLFEYSQIAIEVGSFPDLK